MWQRVLIVGLAVITASSGGATCLEELAAWGLGRPSAAVGGDGTVALVASGSRLAVVDLADPATPAVLGSVELGTVVKGGVRGPDWAAVFDWSRVTLVDLADPERPRLAATVSITGEVSTPAPDVLAIADDTSVGSSDRFVSLFDVADLDDPHIVGTYRAGGIVQGLAGADGLLAVGRYGAVELVDVSDPVQPRRLASLETAGHPVAMSGRTLYLVGSDYSGTRLEVVDLSTPSMPVVTGTLSLPSTADRSILAGSLLVIEADRNQLALIDVSDPGSPELSSYASPETHSWTTLAAVDGVLLVGGELIDVSTPAAPVAVGDLELEPRRWPRGVALTGDRLVLVGGDSRPGPGWLRIFAVGAGGFEEVSSVELPETPGYDVAVDGDIAVVTYDCNCTFDSGAVDLAVIDLSDPTAPALLSTLYHVGSFNVGAWGPPTPPPDVDLSGSLVVVARGWPIDISDPTAPRMFDGGADTAWADDIALDGSVAWAMRNGALCATDYADHAAPVDLGCHELAASLEEVDVDRHLLVASATTPDDTFPADWLYVVDVTVPSAPVERASLQLPGPVTGLVTSDGRAAFTLSLNGHSYLGVVDLTDPDAPQLVGLAPSSAGHIALGGNRIVASTPGTMTLHDPACDEPVMAASMTWQPLPPLLGEDVTFQAVTTDPQAELRWSFSDGVTATGARVQRRFTGLAPVVVTVTASGPSGSTTIRGVVETRSLLTNWPLWSVVPAVAHTDGAAGTRWRTDLALVPAYESQEIAAFLALPGRDNTLQPGRRLTVERGGSTIADVVAGMPDGDGAVGALFLQGRLDTDSSSSRTYAVAGDGSYGQRVPVLEALDLGRSTTDLLLLREDAAFRSNLGVVNLTEEPATALIELYDADGVLLGALEREVPPFGYLQENRVLRQVTTAPVPLARAQVLAPPARVMAWASLVDNRSGDAVFVTHAQPTAVPASWIPVVAHTPGVAGTHWRSDVEVCAVYGDARFELELVRAADAPPPATFDLAGGSCVRFPDIVSEVFGTTGTGALRIRGLVNRVAVTSRTYTATATGATYGQLVPTVPEPFPTPSRGSSLFGLAHSSDPAVGFRSNLGLVNLESEPLAVSVRYSTRDSETLLERTVQLPPHAQLQLNNLLGSFGAGDVEAGRVSVNLVGAPDVERGILAYLSVVDNVTGDPVFLVN